MASANELKPKYTVSRSIKTIQPLQKIVQFFTRINSYLVTQKIHSYAYIQEKLKHTRTQKYTVTPFILASFKIARGRKTEKSPVKTFKKSIEKSIKMCPTKRKAFSNKKKEPSTNSEH